jgi:Flp pilus assembly protein TadG
MIALRASLACLVRRFRDGGERGASSVELAIVVPVFLMLVFGAIDVGLTVSLYNMTSEAARDGARAGQVMMKQGHLGTLSADEQSQIATAALNVTGPLAALGLNGTLTVDSTLEPDASGYWYVKVTATTTYQPLVASFTHLGNTSVSATSRLAVPCGRC